MTCAWFGLLNILPVSFILIGYIPTVIANFAQKQGRKQCRNNKNCELLCTSCQQSLDLKHIRIQENLTVPIIISFRQEFLFK